MASQCVIFVVIIHTTNGGRNMEENEQPVLSAAKIKQLNKQPIIETSVGASEDGKWIIHKTIITEIRSVKYYEKILGPKE